MPPTAPPGEKIIYQSRLHWIDLMLPAILTGFGLLCTLCSLLTAFTEPQPPQKPPPPEMLQCFSFCGISIFAVALLWVIGAIKSYFSSCFTLTNRRIILEKGIFHLHTLDMYLKKIDSLHVTRSIFGRLFGYGTINIRGGSDKPWYFHIADAEKIRYHIQDQIARQ